MTYPAHDLCPILSEFCQFPQSTHKAVLEPWTSIAPVFFHSSVRKY